MRRMVFNFGLLFLLVLCLPQRVFAAPVDSDNDGLSDDDEVLIYHTDPNDRDTDGDGYIDGDEVHYDYDPNNAQETAKLEKVIKVDLKTQTLSYFLGEYKISSFLVSTGKRGYATPKGTYAVDIKKPLVTYKGPGYYYPNIKWNLHFLQGTWGGYYIHGAPWRKTFGYPGSHGCVNVSYANIEPLYNWAEVGTKVEIF